MTQKHLASGIAAVGFIALAACSPSDPSAEAAVIDTSATVTPAGTKVAATPVAATTPAVPGKRTLHSGRQFSIATTEAIGSRTAKPGDEFTATVVTDVLDQGARIAIPAGSLVSGMISDVRSAPTPRGSGTLTLVVNSVTVRGRNYRIEARIDSLSTERAGRPITGNDTAKVGIGAAAAEDSDIRLPAGTHVMITLTRGLTL